MKKIKITEAQFLKLVSNSLLTEDVYMATKNDKTKKIGLKYGRKQSYSKGNLMPSDKLKTDKMDELSKDTYEVPLKGGLMSYNITSINGSEVMHYFKRIFDKHSTFVEFNKEQYQLEMEDAEFKKFMYTFLGKVNAVVKYKVQEFKQENPDIEFTDFAVYPVPSSSRFNKEMANRLQFVSLSGLKSRVVNSEILQKDFTNVKRDEDFINKNKEYYDSELGLNLYKGKTHNDNVNTVKNKLNGFKELQAKIDIINGKVAELLKTWYKRTTISNNPTYYQTLYNCYIDYVNYIPQLEKSEITYQNLLTDTDTKYQVKKSIKPLKYTKGPSVEKRSNEILNVLKEKGFIKWHGLKKPPEIIYRELVPLQIKKYTNDARMGLKDYFTVNDDIASNETNSAETTILLVFDDNISGGATLSDICSKLLSLGFKYIIPITFGKMHEQYNNRIVSVTAPTKFNY